MISDKNINSSSLHSFFCDILNNQGLGKCYQPRPSARLITLTLTFIIPDITKTSSNNCLISTKKRDSRRRQSLAVLAAMEKMGEKKTATQQT